MQILIIKNLFFVLQMNFFCLILGIRDDTGALGDALTTKYLGYAVDSCQMGNFTVMIPGLIDVNMSTKKNTKAFDFNSLIDFR